MPATGRCLCGAVKISLAGEHKEVGACHCAMCRRWGGGPGMALEVKDIEIEGREHVRVYRSSEWAERAFCGTCGSRLYYRLVEAGDMYLSAGILDDQSDLALTSQIFIDEKPAYYTFANETKTMTGAEAFAAFAPAAEKR
jgi:hypothetical protein